MNDSTASLKFAALPAALLTGLFLSACGGNNNTAQSPAVSPAINGVFLDAAVEGLDYETASAKATTGAAGNFSCAQQQSLIFSLGGLKFGSAACASIITPLELAQSSTPKEEKLINRLLTLQTLDEDYELGNGIKIAANVKSALANQTLDFNAAPSDFHAALNKLLSTLPAPYQSRSVDADKRALAREHFEDTLASKVGKPFVDTTSQTNTLGSISVNVTRYQIQAEDKFYVPYEGNDANIKADFPKGFLPAYGSGLTFKGKASDGSLEFYAITDRGPNGDGPKVPAAVVTAGASGSLDAKFFPAPGFSPSIGIISVGKDGAILKSSMPIRFDANTKANGLPLAAGKVGATQEVPLTDAGKYDAKSKTTFSDFGLDTEAIAYDAARNLLWVSDEYGPFIVKIDASTGLILKKYQPGNGATDLPAVLAKRRANRGMEGLSLDTGSGKLQGFIQSPLDDGKANIMLPGANQASSENIRDYAKLVRWVEFDPVTEKTRLYAYPIDAAHYQGGKTGNAKLGDLVALGNNKFIVVEQGAGPDGKVFNRLMLVQIPANATDIAAISSDLEKSSMTGTAINGVNFADIVMLKKTLLLDLNATGWSAEKAEGLALVDEFTLALTNDDDFGLKSAVFNASGQAIAGADITKCNFDANGQMQAGTATSGCTVGNTARVTRGAEGERINRLWLFRFNKKLSDYTP